MTCEECSAPIPVKSGRVPRFCSGACRQRAYRRRRKTPAGFPVRLLEQKRWTRADGKRPITPGGAPASTTDPRTWAAHGDVMSGAGDGFGVMLGGGLGCYDLDSCVAGGKVADWAAREIEAITDPVVLVELSVSGSGLHIFVDAEEKPGRVVRVSGGGTVEKYFRKRFIRVTGDEVSLDGGVVKRRR